MWVKMEDGRLLNLVEFDVVFTDYKKLKASRSHVASGIDILEIKEFGTEEDAKQKLKRIADAIEAGDRLYKL